MARQIIVLDALEDAGGDAGFRVAFWLTVPAARQPFYANPDFVSQVKDGSVTPAELDALRTGAVVERVEALRWPTTTTPKMKAAVIARYTDLQQRINARNPWGNYGTSYDGTSWSSGGAA